MKTLLSLVICSVFSFLTVACGAKDDDKKSLVPTKSGSCSVTASNLTTCTEYENAEATVVDSAEENCADAATWSTEVCSVDDRVGTCSITNSVGITYEIHFSGDYTQELAEASCTASAGSSGTSTYTAAT